MVLFAGKSHRLAGLGLVCLSLALAPAPAARAQTLADKPVLLANPEAMLAAMANYLDKEPDLVVLVLESQKVTQGDVAGVMRSMPASMANLGFQDLYHRALDVMVRQKAMVLRAQRDGLDKDPTVVRRGEIAFERVLSDAWLQKKSDAAVTEAALRARYDRDVAGRPGADEVRARVILVPSEAQAKLLIAQVAAGADFADLARLYSKDPTASRGGDLGFVTRESVSPEVGSAMFSLAPGQVTANPVASFAGYFVVRAEARQSMPTPGFAQARPLLERYERAEAVKNAIASLLTNITFVENARKDDMPGWLKP